MHAFIEKLLSFFSEREHWKVANEKILQEKKRLEYQKEEDDIKIKEYTVRLFSFGCSKF